LDKAKINGLIKIIKKAEFKEDEVKSSVIENFLLISKNNDSNQIFSLLKEILIHTDIGNLKYRADTVCQLYKSISEKKYTKDIIRELQDLSKSLYSNNELIQIELFKMAISDGLINKYNIAFLDLNQIQDDSLVFDLIYYAQIKKALPKESDILKLIRGRTNAKYDSLKEILIQKDSLKEYLTEDGFTKIKEFFGEEYLQKNNITISDLFSYFDVTNKLIILSKILKPEIKEEIKNKFHPSDKILLVEPKEIKKFYQLITGKELNDADLVSNPIAQQFLPNEVLCNYFLNKNEIKAIKDLTSEEIKSYKLNFKGTNLEIKEKKEDELMITSKLTTNELLVKQQDDLNNSFRNLLRQNPLNQDEVAKFFSDALSIDISDINDGKKKIAEFFTSNKKELAHFFTTEGLGELAGVMGSLGDGCSKNIGNQFTTLLYQSILTKKSDSILFQLLRLVVIPAILNKGGDILILKIIH